MAKKKTKNKTGRQYGRKASAKVQEGDMRAQARNVAVRTLGKDK
jgi:hypothetical protein